MRDAEQPRQTALSVLPAQIYAELPAQIYADVTNLRGPCNSFFSDSVKAGTAHRSRDPTMVKDGRLKACNVRAMSDPTSGEAKCTAKPFSSFLLHSFTPDDSCRGGNRNHRPHPSAGPVHHRGSGRGHGFSTRRALSCFRRRSPSTTTARALRGLTHRDGHCQRGWLKRVASESTVSPKLFSRCSRLR